MNSYKKTAEKMNVSTKDLPAMLNKIGIPIEEAHEVVYTYFRIRKNKPPSSAENFAKAHIYRVYGMMPKKSAARPFRPIRDPTEPRKPYFDPVKGIHVYPPGSLPRRVKRRKAA